MKNCTHCGTTNPNAAKFCLDCGTELSSQAAPLQQVVLSTLPPEARIIESDQSEASTALVKPNSLRGFRGLPNQYRQQRQADIMFVLDCTGSMQGEIDAVRDAIVYFVEAIEAEAVKIRVGLIEFRDRLIQEEHRVLQFEGHPFTNDPVLFRQQVFHLKAQGGGDEPESSLDAMMLALEQPFDAESSKVIVLITDAPPHIPDQETRDITEVVDRIQKVGIDQVYIVMRTKDKQNQIYLKLLEGTRGLAFDIGRGNDFSSRSEDFKRTLMALSQTISLATVGH